MRAFPFFIAVALAIESLTGSLVARFVMRSLSDTQRAAPAITQLFFGHPGLLWIVPSLYAAYAVNIGIRRDPSARSLWVFFGIAAIAAALLLGVILVAAILPLLTFKA